MKASLKNRLVRHTKSLIHNFKNDLSFSGRLAFTRAAGDICLDLFKAKEKGLQLKQKKDALVRGLLEKGLNDVVERTKEIREESVYSENAPIWICWWQGMEQAPELIKRCVESTVANANTHEVKLITKDTIDQYFEIPEYINAAVREGRMGLANLADYIRYSLIFLYGGIWIDATVYTSQPIPENCFEKRFFTLKDEKIAGPSLYNSAGRWTTFVIGGWKGSKLFRFLKNSFEEYWKNNDTIIDYLMADYLIEIAYNRFPDVRESMDALPANNLNRNKLRDAMMENVSKEEFSEVVKADTIFYKLSYKSKYGLKTADGKETIYAALLKNEISRPSGINSSTKSE